MTLLRFIPLKTGSITGVPDQQMAKGHLFTDGMGIHMCVRLLVVQDGARAGRETVGRPRRLCLHLIRQEVSSVYTRLLLQMKFRSLYRLLSVLNVHVSCAR